MANKEPIAKVTVEFTSPVTGQQIINAFERTVNQMSDNYCVKAPRYDNGDKVMVGQESFTPYEYLRIEGLIDPNGQYNKIVIQDTDFDFGGEKYQSQKDFASIHSSNYSNKDIIRTVKEFCERFKKEIIY